MSLGNSGNCVNFLQFLIELGDNHIGGPPAINGNFDAVTNSYVVEFQSQNGIRPTGTVDSKTWTKFQSCVNLQATSIDTIWICQRLTP
ncbi:MAG TPA: peptidoglycan-binding domain-containing protein [Candidatus Saccharimonadales bacterium]|nr:peptidoglycan-binding domain-containing protein [Candidatus Saccharimonadales bacterium]